MKIRSITCFTDLTPAYLAQAKTLAEVARPAFEGAGFTVQTARLATPPFPTLLPQLTEAALLDLAQSLEAEARQAGFDYLALGPALPSQPESYALIPQILAHTENVFFSAHLGQPESGVSLAAVNACADIIQQAATLEPNGFGNLYFAALANVPPGAPFFPAAYHQPDAPPRFALALEAADVAVSAVRGASSLAEAQQNLVTAVETQAQKLIAVAETVSAQSGVAFGGLDFTLAPFPTEAQSLGTALAELSGVAVGHHGSLAAAALLTSTLDTARYPRTGFNGLMLPVLEDSTLAQAAAQGSLSVKDLLLYSAVCGTGLDTIPLPGNISQSSLAAVLLDVATLAYRLNKPLTARLMPIPGKNVGEMTTFDFAFFANSRVMGVESSPLGGLFQTGEAFGLSSRLG
jgi:uncharacterized protein (UPF0210 family)